MQHAESASRLCVLQTDVRVVLRSCARALHATETLSRHTLSNVAKAGRGTPSVTFGSLRTNESRRTTTYCLTAWYMSADMSGRTTTMRSGPPLFPLFWKHWRPTSRSCYAYVRCQRETRKRVHIQSQGTHLGDPSRRVLVADNRIRLSDLHACAVASTL